MQANTHDEKGLPASPPKPLASWYAQGLSDGLGDRLLMFDNSTAPSLELLRFRPEIARIPGFETALRDQVGRFRQFQHPAFVPVRAVQRLEPDDDLALISNCTPGKRLSEVLHRAQGPAFAATLIRQLAPALLALQQHDAGISHGVLSADRIVVSPEGALTIVEHVVGPAIDTLGLRTSELVALGIALPPAADAATPRLDVATDWYQLGLVAVSVLLGRPVTAGELPQLETLLHALPAAGRPDGPVLSPFVRQWLERALQISGNRIGSGAEAHAVLNELLRKEQPGDSRRFELVRQGPGASPAATSAAPRLADPPVDGAAAIPASLTPTRPAAGTGEAGLRLVAVSPAVTAPSVEAPVMMSPVVGAPGSPTPTSRSISAVYEPNEAPPQAPEVQGSIDQGALALFELEQEATKKRSDSAKRSAFHDRPVATPPPATGRPAATRPAGPDRPAITRPAGPDRPAITRPRLPDRPLATRPRLPGPPVTKRATLHTPEPAPAPRPVVIEIERKGISPWVVAALVLLVAMEAGVIAWLGSALWLAPPPAIAVETTPSGGSVSVSTRSTEAAPLRLTAAPDLRWVNVTSPSQAGLLGGGANALTGSLRISSPIPLKVFEKSRQLGAVPGGDLKIPAGLHDIELVNPALGYRLQQSIEVEAGQTVSIHVAPPVGWVTIYAVPTAEVLIGGQVVGRTPLGPLPIALGDHQITFRHSSGLQDRQRVTVKSGETVRVIGNLRR
jgi:hypothetical protein